MEPVHTRPVELLYQPAAPLRIRPKTCGNYRHRPDIVYAEAHGVGLIMDVFEPTEKAAGFGVIDVISGGWHSDRTLLNEHVGLGLIDALCEQGLTVFAVSPGSLPLFTGREMVQHIHAAIRHIKFRANEYGISSNAIGILGASAGGHLAALTALHPQHARRNRHDPLLRLDTRIQAAALFFAPTDLLDFGGARFDRFQLEGLKTHALLFHEGLKGKSDAEIINRLGELSPARIPIEETPPPFLIMHGKADRVVPWQQSEKLAQALQEAGGQVEMHYKEGGGHVWPDIEGEMQKAARWMKNQLHSCSANDGSQ